MKYILSNWLVVVGTVAFWGQCAMAEFHWPNRQNVIRAANELAEGIEHLDTALHSVRAPEDLIQLVHHYEETVTEFIDEVTRGISYREASDEMNHIRQDYGLIRDKIYQYSHLLQYSSVSMESRHVRSAYRALDHEMFRWDTNRWTPDRVTELEQEKAEIKAYHDQN